MRKTYYSISVFIGKLEELKEKNKAVSLEIQSNEQQIKNSQELLSYSSFYKNKGQYEIYESCKKYHSLSSHKFPYSFKKDYGGDQDWKKEIIQSYYRIILLCRQRPEMWKQLTGF